MRYTHSVHLVLRDLQKRQARLVRLTLLCCFPESGDGCVCSDIVWISSQKTRKVSLATRIGSDEKKSITVGNGKSASARLFGLYPRAGRLHFQDYSVWLNSCTLATTHLALTCGLPDHEL